MTSIRFSKGNNSVELYISISQIINFSMHITSNNNAFMLYQVILHDCIVLGIVSESQTQILPRPIERAEVKFSLSYTFSFIFTMVSNRFVRECFHRRCCCFFEPMSF